MVKNRNNYLIECLSRLSIPDIPAEWDGASAYKTAIAYVKRDNSLEDYVIVKKKNGKVCIAKDFGFGRIVKILNIYPTTVFPSINKEELEKLTTFSELKAFVFKVAEERADPDLKASAKKCRKLDEIKDLINNL